MMNGDVSALFLLRLLETYPKQPILLLEDRTTWHWGRSPAHSAEPPGCQPYHRHAKQNLLAAAFEHHLNSTRFPCSLLDNLAFPSPSPMFN